MGSTINKSLVGVSEKEVLSALIVKLRVKRYFILAPVGMMSQLVYFIG